MASNANVNKVIYGGNVLVDLTGDTVAANRLLSGYTAHDSSGARVTGNIPGKAAQTYTPGVSAQTIAAGQYLAGAQTIQGDANLTAANIAEGVSIFGVTGTHSGGSGGGGYAPNDVNFFDYEGTIVYSCSAADFANLTAMPENPSHTDIGLTAQGWNWSLTNAKAYVAAYGILDIGQMYVPTDGKTHIFLTLDADRPATRRTFELRFTASVNGGVKINWGDGSAVETSSGTSFKVYPHTYAANGDYEVTLEVTSGTLTFPGTDGNSGYSLYGTRAKNTIFGKQYMIRKVFFGNGIQTVGNYALYWCHLLSEVTIPHGVTTLGENAFYNNVNLKYCTIPDTVTETGTYTFSECYNLRYISLSRGLTDIKDRAFYKCSGLQRVAVPNTVTKLWPYAFADCHSITKIALPNSIITMSSGSIYNEWSLREVTLPANLEGTIGTYAIGYNQSLTHIDIPAGVTKIDASAFDSCKGLTKITIPAAVATIGNSAFGSIFSIGEIHVKPETPPTLGSNVFYGAPSNCVIYVPYSADHSILAAYQAATNWSAYASMMVEEPQ